jgi:hypothetical protein
VEVQGDAGVHQLQEPSEGAIVIAGIAIQPWCE